MPPPRNVKKSKDAFLNKYNPTRSEEVAVAKAITAALQHNSLYHPDASIEEKAAVRCEWRKFLHGKQQKYQQKRSSAEYERDVASLKRLMNNKWSEVFRNDQHPKFKTDPGFRISHAQKSLGVYLKHLWCMGNIAEPTQCPVDRIILGKAGARYPADKWGYVNSLGEHRLKIGILLKASSAKKQTIAKWELLNF